MDRLGIKKRPKRKKYNNKKGGHYNKDNTDRDKHTTVIHQDSVCGLSHRIKDTDGKIHLSQDHLINIYPTTTQREKNLGSRVALLPRKFFPNWKVFQKVQQNIFAIKKSMRNT